MNISELIKESLKGKSQKEFAEACGLSQSKLSRLLSGKTSKLNDEEVTAISEYTGISREAISESIEESAKESTGFNAEKFRYLFTKAIGNKSHSDFAAAIGISEASVSRISLKLLSRAPDIGMLRKIAENSDVEIEDLLEACGYENEEYITRTASLVCFLDRNIPGKARDLNGEFVKEFGSNCCGEFKKNGFEITTEDFDGEYCGIWLAEFPEEIIPVAIFWYVSDKETVYLSDYSLQNEIIVEIAKQQLRCR